MNLPAKSANALVLLVDNDRALLEHVAAALRDEFEIESAQSGEAAFATVPKRRPDLVITDVELPGMGGIELVRLLRDTPGTASIPILIVSGRAVDELKEAFELGADGYLGKPYTDRELRIRIRTMLKNERLRAETVRREMRLEEQRRVDRERAALLESITDAFYALDGDWRVTYVNQRALDYFGVSRDALMGHVFWDVFPQLRNTVAQRASERAVREQISIALEFQSAVSGRWLEVHAYPHQQGIAVHFRDISDRKRADVLLRESERRLRLMSDALPALVSYIDTDYRYRFCNRRYEQWFGIASADILGRTMGEILGATAFATLKPHIDRALNGEVLALEARVPYRTGGTRDVQIDYVPERDEAGTVRGTYALVQDITGRKEAELRLRESEARFRSMADNAPVMVWVTEADGSCSYLSKSWYEFTGLAVDSGLGMGWLRAIHPDDMPPTEAKFIEANTQRKPYRMEYRLRRADGRYAWAMDAASPRFNEAGEFLGFVGSLIDIQARREMEEQLRSLNETLERRVADVVAERKVFADLVEGTDAFIQVVDLDYRWLAINRASASEFERLYGVRPKVGDSMIELLADKPEHQSAIRSVWSRALAGEAFTEIAEFGEPTRARRFYEMKFNSLRDRSGRLIGAYQFVYDVTQRISDQARLIEAQDALRQSQKMETLGQLTGGVAHDFNNLLTPIVGALDMLSRRVDGDARSQRLTSGALQAAERAKTLIQRLLAFARRQHLQARAVNIGMLLDGIRELLARTLAPHIELSIRVDDRLPAVRVDPNQLELALLNLAVNARDAMPEGGALLIRASADDETDGQHTIDRYVRICVQDNGVGMDAETLTRAIEPFFTTKGVGRGTGLGLSMVHGLAAQSGGDFLLESTPGGGTTAVLRLPVADEQPSEAHIDEGSDSTPAKATATVLLVDDEALVRIATADMLIDGGYHVAEASNAEEALRLVQDGLKVDAVVTDFAMPGRSGAQLARELRSLQPNLPILMITGFASLTDKEGGGLPRLAKPFRQTDLLSCLAEAMSTAAD